MMRLRNTEGLEGISTLMREKLSALRANTADHPQSLLLITTPLPSPHPNPSPSQLTNKQTDKQTKH
jgi:hypothetical protein